MAWDSARIGEGFVAGGAGFAAAAWGYAFIDDCDGALVSLMLVH